MNVVSKENPLRDHSSDSTFTERTNYLAKGGSISLVGLVLGKLLTLVTEVFLARFLGAASYGSYSLARTIIQIPNFATNLGMPQGVVRFGAIYQSKDEFENQKGLLNGSLLIAVGFGFLVSFIIYINSYRIASWFDKTDLEPLIRILTWILAPSGLTAIVASYARSQRRIELDVLVRIFFQPFIVLLLCLLFVGLFGFGSRGAAYSFLLAAILNALLGLIFTIRVFFPALKIAKSAYFFKQWLRFSIPTFILGVSALLLRYTSRLLLGYYGQSEAVGIFTAASALADNLAIFLMAFNPMFAPVVAAFYEKGDLSGLAKNFKITSRWQLMFTLPFGLIVIVFAKELMTIFGSDFQSSTGILVVITLAQLINVGTGSVGMILQMTGHQDLEFFNGVLVFIINLLLGIWLIPRYGVLGAGFTTAISLSTIHLIRVIEVYYLLRITPYERAYFKIIIATFTSFTLLMFLKGFLNIDSGLDKILLGTPITLISYVLVLWSLKFETIDKLMINNIANRLRKK